MENQLPIWQEARVFVIEGNNAADFLQGYLTCDTRRLASIALLPMAICNVKGRVLASGWALALPNGVGLLVHSTLLEPVAAFLRPYINFSKCSADAQSALWVSVADTPSPHCLGEAHYLHLHSTHELQESNVHDISGTVNAWLVDQGFAFISAPVSAQFLPQMLNLDQLGAVDFDKGCYLGQEIVARAQFRGAVKRHLQTFAWQDDPPALGASLDGIGIVAAYAPDQDGNAGGYGLAIAKD
jgi:tRNA-modifying protein YgfZ